MHTIKENFSNKMIINKSIFITNIFSVTTEDEISNIIKDIRKKYYDAKHNCYAYILGDSQNIQKASDDGEPSKTAGYPMLNILKKKEMTNILVITTRYFGGIKLGAGGLIRAYGNSVSETLNISEIYHFEHQTKINLVLDYSTYNVFLAKDFNISIIDSAFTDKVILTLGVNKELLESFLMDLNNLLLGNKTYEILEDFIILVLDE